MSPIWNIEVSVHAINVAYSWLMGNLYECATHLVHIFLAESTSWRWNGAQKKRPLSSVVLEPGVKDMLIADAKDFLASEAWYADRGIPYRRGYLLYGVPGSGKTSLIHGETVRTSFAKL